jgi:hypothetical protein
MQHPQAAIPRPPPGPPPPLASLAKPSARAAALVPPCAAPALQPLSTRVIATSGPQAASHPQLSNAPESPALTSPEPADLEQPHAQPNSPPQARQPDTPATSIPLPVDPRLRAGRERTPLTRPAHELPEAFVQRSAPLSAAPTQPTAALNTRQPNPPVVHRQPPAHSQLPAKRAPNAMRGSDPLPLTTSVTCCVRPNEASARPNEPPVARQPD